MCAILNFVTTLKDLPQELNKFVEEIKKDEKQVTQLCDSQELSLTKAKEISELYLQPIEYTTFTKADNTVSQNQLYYAKSAKEIVTAVGIFNPSDKSHNSTQTWQVLLHYGKSNFFTEKDYIDALFHISRRDTKTILIEFDQLNKSLKQILEHFASIYSVRRSLVSDCRAVKKINSTKIGPFCKNFFLPHKTFRNRNHNRNLQLLLRNLRPQNRTLFRNLQRIDPLFSEPLANQLHLIDRKHLLQLEVEKEKNGEKERIVSPVSKLDHPALISLTTELNEIKETRKARHNLISHLD
jgi:hypothetical protein